MHINNKLHLFRRLLHLILFLPLISVGAEQYVYTGLEFVRSDIRGEFSVNDALVVVGGELWLDKHIGLAAEAGFPDRGMLQGVIVKGSALALFKPMAASAVAPVFFGGFSGARLVQEQCSQEIISFSSGYAGVTQCQNGYIDTSGTTFGIGFNIRRSRRSFLTVRFSAYRGHDATTLRSLGVAASF